MQIINGYVYIYRRFEWVRVGKLIRGIDGYYIKYFK
jgi:hypothetical protein